MKKKLSVLLCSLTFCTTLSGCSSNDKEIIVDESSKNDNFPVYENVPRPEKITLTALTCMKFEEGLQHICDEYKEKMGIELEITLPESKQYYEEVAKQIASSNAPNVIELGSVYYPKYANDGLLWDMSKAWETSQANVKNIADTEYIDALRIDGKLFGFPLAKGNGTITYVRGDWLQQLSLSAPTNYGEFINMLRAFKSKCASPYTAAGIINNESPYNIYLREFYQDANPDFYKVNGTYVDGMLQPQMKAALERIRSAYAEGLIDKVIVTNDTSSAREKFETGEAGVFNYWAGAFNKKMNQNIKKYLSKLASNAQENGMPNAAELKAQADAVSIIPIAPIAETKYIERPPSALAITTKTTNPLGVYKYFIEYAHDGGEGQMLFTRGVEGIHWEKAEDGTITALKYNEKNNKTLEKSYYNPELAFTPCEMDTIPIDPVITNSLNLFKSNSYIEEVPKTSDSIEENRVELEKIRKEIMASIILSEITVDEGIQDYQKRAGEYSENILNELNGIEVKETMN